MLQAEILARRIGYETKTVLARYPKIALPIAKLRGHGESFGPDTDIVIEGYPRSANSFAVHAFRAAQNRPVRISHHVHAPAQVIAAVNLGVPALVLIREPEDAVLDLVIAKRYPSIRQALRGYARFYEPLLPYLEQVVVAPFEEVTADFGAVIARVNRMCGTDFLEFEHTDENVRSSFEAIAADWATRLPDGPTFERLVPRPSPVRDRLRDELRDGYRSEALDRLRERADSVRHVFVARGS